MPPGSRPAARHISAKWIVQTLGTTVVGLITAATRSPPTCRRHARAIADGRMLGHRRIRRHREADVGERVVRGACRRPVA